MDAFVIIDAAPADFADRRAVVRAAWLATYPNPSLGITEDDIRVRFDDVSEDYLTRLEALANATNQDRNQHTWIARHEGVVAGVCEAMRNGTAGRIMALYVHPDHQSRGIGRALMTTAMRWINTALPMVLDVAEYNERAIAFYRRFGFIPSGNSVSTPVRPLPSGVVIPEIEMVRRPKQAGGFSN